MNKKTIKATHQGEIKIGDITIPCAVLEDGTRVLRERSVATALGKKGGGAYWKRKKEEKGAILPEYISAKKLAPFIDDKLRDKLLNSITYETLTGGEAQGIDAKLLPEVCDIWLKAREKGALSETQKFTAKQAEILVRGFAQIGIIALVDEATGYQYDRNRKDLEEILEKFISKELNKWAKTFPDEFYEQLFRLQNWQYNPISVKRPSYIGKLTNDIVYKRLAPGVLDELKRLTPKTQSGHMKNRLFQRLTTDVGHPRLREHLASVITLMRVSKDWEKFYRMLQRALPRYDKNFEFDLETDDGEPI